MALYEFDGLSKNPVQEAHAGEIVALSGMADITIGRTPVSYTHLDVYKRQFQYHVAAADFLLPDCLYRCANLDFVLGKRHQGNAAGIVLQINGIGETVSRPGSPGGRPATNMVHLFVLEMCIRDRYMRRPVNSSTMMT